MPLHLQNWDKVANDGFVGVLFLHCHLSLRQGIHYRKQLIKFSQMPNMSDNWKRFSFRLMKACPTPNPASYHEASSTQHYQHHHHQHHRQRYQHRLGILLAHSSLFQSQVCQCPRRTHGDRRNGVRSMAAKRMGDCFEQTIVDGVINF